MMASRAGGGRGVTSGRVWVLDDDGKPKPVGVRIGLADGTYSELVGSDLKEGSQIIVGTQADAKARAQQAKGGPRFGF
jgi:HlyD family secretion protein